MRLLPLLLVAGCVPGASDDRDAAPAGDIVLVTLDTTRADHLGAYGYPSPTSPFLDSLAAAGARFERAWAASPLTLVSHASLFTGLDPPRHGVRNNGFYRLPTDLPTLAEQFEAAGWRAAAFVGAPVLDARHGLARGFEHYDDELSVDAYESHLAIPTRPVSRTVERALEWVEGVPDDERILLWIHAFEPHAPYQPPPELERLFAASPFPAYDAEIRAVDDALRGLDDELTRAGRDPLWVVTSDHGEGLGEHGEWTHGVFLYESTLHVPLILSGPGVDASGTHDYPARHVDLVPTLLELAGLPELPGLDGRSLVPVLEGKADGDAPAAYAETYHPLELYGWSPLHAVVEDDWRFVEAPRDELYAWTEDPNELDNRVETDRPRAERLMRVLTELRDRDAYEPSRFRPAARVRANLAALGYASSERSYSDPDDLPDPKDRVEVAAAIERAQILFMAGDVLRATELLVETAELDPTNPYLCRLGALEPLRAIGDGAIGARRSERERLLAHAHEFLDRWAELDPDLPGPGWGAAFAAEVEGDLDSAEAGYMRVLATHPGHFASLVALLELALDRDDTTAIVERALGVLAVDAGHRPARHAAARYTLRAGDAATALGHYERLYLAAVGPERELVALRSAECLQRLGRHAEALERFAEVGPELGRAAGVAALEAESRRAQAVR